MSEQPKSSTNKETQAEFLIKVTIPSRQARQQIKRLTVLLCSHVLAAGLTTVSINSTSLNQPLIVPSHNGEACK